MRLGQWRCGRGEETPSGRGLGGDGTHRDEREGAGRVDRDTPGVAEPGSGAGALAEASRAAAGEGGGRPVGEVDALDPVAAILLRCIRGHTLSAEAIGSVVCVLAGTTSQGTYAVRYLRDGATHGVQARRALRRAQSRRSGRSRCRAG